MEESWMQQYPDPLLLVDRAGPVSVLYLNAPVLDGAVGAQLTRAVEKAAQRAPIVLAVGYGSPRVKPDREGMAALLTALKVASLQNRTLTIAAAPFVARLVEAALREVDHGLVEAAQAMGATTSQIVWKVLLPEALPGIVAGLTITFVSLTGYSAMAGAIGGGGLGDLGIRYGYQRFLPEIMLAVVLVLIFFVQAVQSLGDWAVRRLSHR